MPNKNKTGPLELGPRTGRQMGNCTEAQPTQEMDRRQDGSFGKGFCWRNLNKEQMKQLLELRKAAIEKEIKDIK